MTVLMQKEVERLKKAILGLASLVANNVNLSVRAAAARDASAARQVMKRDAEVDSTEIEVEEECLKILALHQPVAVDLRFIVAVLKINNDLERVGDLAVNICENALSLSGFPQAPAPYDLSGMGEKVNNMLNSAIDALVNLDDKLAREVCAMDDTVDDINRHMYSQIKECLRMRPHEIDCLIHFLSISRHLERIADHATNIAEEVIYMTKGEIIRHKRGSNEPAE
jgi:phosphate transport system protein